MYHVPHLLHVFLLPVRKRSVEFCNRENKACMPEKNLDLLEQGPRGIGR